MIKLWKQFTLSLKKMQERSEPEKADNGIQMRTNLKNGWGLNIMTSDITHDNQLTYENQWWPFDQLYPTMTNWPIITNMISNDDQYTNDDQYDNDKMTIWTID